MGHRVHSRDLSATNCTCTVLSAILEGIQAAKNEQEREIEGKHSA
jgi:hypothetical protein